MLVVDDDAAFVEFATQLLEGAGYSVVCATDGESAIAAAEAGRPLLAFVDVNLPGVSGYEVCRRLREDFGDAIGVIFLSGDRVESFDRVGGLMLGADDYITKPFDADELLARARGLLRRVGKAEPANARAPHANADLTPREQEVLELLASGLAQGEIAGRLVISPKTVSTHIQRILGKLGVHSRAEAVALAHRDQLVAR